MEEQNSTNSQDGVELPAKLIRDLRAVVGTQVPVPTEIDKVVLAEARDHLGLAVDSRTPRKPAWWITRQRWLSSSAAALAATVLIAIGIRSLRAPLDGPPVPGQPATFAREDLDRSGRVDILDAFMLSRHLDKGGVVNTAWDMNQDGRVDRDDVQQIAQSAVRLQPKG